MGRLYNLMGKYIKGVVRTEEMKHLSLPEGITEGFLEEMAIPLITDK